MNKFSHYVSCTLVLLPLLAWCSVGYSASKSVTSTEQDLRKAVKLLDHTRVKHQFYPSKNLRNDIQKVSSKNKRPATLNQALVGYNHSDLKLLLQASSKARSSRYVPCYKYGYSQLQSKSKKYQRSITEASRRHGVNENLIKSVITAESCFKIRARSHKGAQGLMQLMPATARRFGVRNSYNSHQNIEAGARYLRWLLNRYKGNMRFALAGYNAGEGKVDRYGGIPPYKETKEYVRRVMNVYKTLQNKQEMPGYRMPHSVKKSGLQKTQAEYHRIWQQKQAQRKVANRNNTIPLSDRRCVEAVPKHLTYQTRLKRSGRGGRIWQRYYNMQTGENLSHVMRKTGIHINTIKRMNHLTSKSNVLAGHQLLVWECRA